MPDDTLSYHLVPVDVERDFDRILALLHTVETHDHGDDPVSASGLRSMLSYPGLQPARDCRIALTDDNRIVGWAWVWHNPPEALATIIVAVLPAARRQGVGSTLLGFCHDQAGRSGAQTAGMYIPIHLTPARLFAEHHTYVPISANTLLRHTAPEALPAPRLPDGLMLRTHADNGDTDMLVQAFEDCYAGLWGHHPLTDEHRTTWLPTLDPHDLFLLFAPDNHVIGMFRLERRDDGTVFIDAPGIVPAWRSIPLYHQLLLTACAQTIRQTPVALELESWGDDPAVLNDYQHLGFAIVRQHIAYERSLAV